MWMILLHLPVNLNAAADDDDPLVLGAQKNFSLRQFFRAPTT